jgi:hypothetical protein
MNGRLCFAIGIVFVCIFANTSEAQDKDLPTRAVAGLKRVTDYFRQHVATEGGYLWQYSADLKLREGEGKASATTVWVQPPGTPSVGLAFLRAYEATGDKYYLEAARAAGMALVKGQLQSGGWDYRIEFDPKARKTYAYRQEPNNPKGRNVTTLDDNTTQEALRLLMRLDQTQGFKDTIIHEAAEFALTSLLRAQYPNGAWAQRFDTFPDPDKYPIKKANYPDTWPREYPSKDYKGFYTLNDNAQADVIDIMFEAARIYKNDPYRQAAIKGADFFLLAQMPEPQPIWAQQYNHGMQPVWARKFEPPAVTGGESQGVMLTLLKVYRQTSDKKYLEPLPRAIAYLRKIELPGGKLARFYELKTDKPLYFTTKYVLTYKDNDLPTHYGFKVGSKADQIAKELERVQKLSPDQLLPKPGTPSVSKSMEQNVRSVLAALDEQGRWLEEGQLKQQDDGKITRQIISCRTFIRNLDVLSGYLRAVNAKKAGGGA